MKILFSLAICLSYLAFELYEAGTEDLGESPLFDYGTDLKGRTDNPNVVREMPVASRTPQDGDVISSEPASENHFAEQFRVKEDQLSPLTAKELHEVAFGEEFESGLSSEEVEDGNSTSTDSIDTAIVPEDANNNNSSSTLVACASGKLTGGEPVELVNSTRLMNLLITEPNVTSRRSLAECVTVLFYARYCPFSCMAAPHYNALPRAFPDIKMVAVDAMKHPSFNTQYGIVGVPTVMLFHNGRPAAKFNDSEYTLEMFARFINKYTGMEPQHKLYVTSADFGGPVPSVPIKETDYCLALSWIFILICSIYFFSKSSWWQWIVEAIQNTWRDAEAQHEHAD